MNGGWDRKEIEVTADGSATIYLPELDEHYHSTKGALTESRHVFVESGLKHCRKDAVRVLEIGFGTGLNAVLTAIYGKGLQIEYHTCELYPLSLQEVEALGYRSVLPEEGVALLENIHEAEWEMMVEICPGFSIKKIRCDLTDSSVRLPQGVDVVYFDAFAPEKQPGMWTDGIFRRIYAAMESGGILTTYCAKGEVRRRLQSVGFSVERLAGPPGGKREILRAVK